MGLSFGMLGVLRLLLVFLGRRWRGTQRALVRVRRFARLRLVNGRALDDTLFDRTRPRHRFSVGVGRVRGEGDHAVLLGGGVGRLVEAEGNARGREELTPLESQLVLVAALLAGLDQLGGKDLP